jgi:hypothetical protein
MKFLLLGFERGCSFKLAIGSNTQSYEIDGRNGIKSHQVVFDGKHTYTLYSLLCMVFHCDFG